ncbi:MAG: hypothetical protein DMG91_07895 [Acidobacteria bacterium]|nr:MAG: hypothetical protein DMG91_07895 [Acidobacteriota bacterium]
MSTTSQQNKCAHPNCTCPAAEGEYCSQACATASTGEAASGMSATSGCGCNHPECRAARAA